MEYHIMRKSVAANGAKGAERVSMMCAFVRCRSSCVPRKFNVSCYSDVFHGLEWHHVIRVCFCFIFLIQKQISMAK